MVLPKTADKDFPFARVIGRQIKLKITLFVAADSKFGNFFRPSRLNQIQKLINFSPLFFKKENRQFTVGETPAADSNLIFLLENSLFYFQRWRKQDAFKASLFFGKSGARQRGGEWFCLISTEKKQKLPGWGPTKTL